MIFKRIMELAEKDGSKEILKTRSCSYTAKALWDRILNAAKYIESLGLKEGEPLGLAFPNSGEFIVFLLAAEMTCHPAVLLGAMLKPREILYHVENSGIRKVFASPHIAEHFVEAGTKEPGVFESVDCWTFANTKGFDGFMEGDFVCQLTSGTNGMSKGVIRTSKAVLEEIQAVRETVRYTPCDTVLVIPPIHHAFGLMLGCFPALYSGAKCILWDGFMPQDVKKVMTDEKVSVMFAVPFMYHLLNQISFDHPSDFSSLRLCVTGGAPLHPDVNKAFMERYGKGIANSYGSTETGAMTLSMENCHQENSDSINDSAKNTNSVGKPLGGRIIKAFDENGVVLPAGTTGILWTRSEANSRIYLYPQELNPSVFKDGWYSTGDMGSVDEDGTVYVTGRKSNMINVAGLKVDPAEVEAVINSIPGVREVVVVGIDTGAGGQIVKAVIVQDAAGVSKKEVLDYCKKQLSNFKLPRVIEFMDEIPKSQTGKIIRKYLI